MKKYNKLFALLLALVMILGLAACGKDAEPTTPPPAEGQPVEETPDAAIGAVTLAGLSRVTMHYDANGNVVLITDSDDTACFSQLFGTPCTEAVAQILQADGGVYAETFLLIKQEVNTLLPNENFLQALVTAAQKKLGKLPVILSAATDQDAQGYFSPETAEAIIAAYLGNPSNIDYLVPAVPEDGYYHINVTSAVSSENYTVGALYGAVDLQAEPEDNFVEGEGEYIDFDALLDADPVTEGELPTEAPPAQG